MSLIIIEQELIDYRIPLYERIAQQLSEELVLYHWNKSQNLGHKIIQKHKITIETKSINVINVNNKIVIPNLCHRNFYKRKNTIIIRGNVRNPFLIPFLILNRILGVKTIVWGQAISRKRIFKPYSNILDLFNLLVLKSSSAYVLYDDTTKKQLSKYITTNKLFVANNTIDTKKEYTYLKELQKRKKSEVKKELNINSAITLCYIGRLSERKKIPYLLDVHELISKHIPNVSLLIIGQGPELEKVKKIISSKKLRNVRLIGSKYEFDAAKYLYASDITIMPGWLGLAVNHSLIYGLPIVSQKENDFNTNHAPESMHLKHKYNGWFAKHNDKKDMVNGILEIIKNYNYYSNNASKYALDNLSIDKLVEGFVEAYNYVKK